MDFYCDVIMDEASKMNDMVRKLLTLNQMEWNEEPVIERFNVTELIQSVISNNGIRTSQNGINVIFDQKEPVYVWGDEYLIPERIFRKRIYLRYGTSSIRSTKREQENTAVTESDFLS